MLKRLLIGLLTLTMVLAGGVDTYKAETQITEEEIIVNTKNKAVVDEIIEESIIEMRAGALIEGIYRSAELETGFAGYTYRISFDWEVIDNGAGDYVFSEISNIKVTTYRYENVLDAMWSSYTHVLNVGEPDYTTDASAVSIDITYTFYSIDKYDLFGNMVTTRKELNCTKTADDLTN